MYNLQTALDDLYARMEDVEMDCLDGLHEMQELQKQALDTAKALRTMRMLIPLSIPENFKIALDKDIEHSEDEAHEACKYAAGRIEEFEDEYGIGESIQDCARIEYNLAKGLR